MADGFDIPASFWNELTEEEFGKVCETSTLDAEQCAKLWRHLGRPGEPPTSITIMVNRDDVLNIWPDKIPP